MRQNYLGKIVYGTPYFQPWYFNSTILTIRKEKPRFLRCKAFKEDKLIKSLSLGYSAGLFLSVGLMFLLPQADKCFKLH